MTAPVTQIKSDARLGEFVGKFKARGNYIVSCDSSCPMQAQGLLDRQGKPIKTIHLTEILAGK